jgi:4-aminobutyrate aminotransferase
MLGRLRELQRKHRSIVDVRGLGLMIGVEFSRDADTMQPWAELRDAVVNECFNRGLIIQGAGESSIRFSPPLLINREQADFAIATCDEAIASAASRG